MKCTACPIAGPCMGERSDHRYACGVDPKVESFLRWMASDEKPSAEQGGDPVEDRPTVVESLSLLDRARECPHRTKPSCSCTFSHCRLDGRDKSSSECLACIRDRPASSPASAALVGVFLQ